MMHPYKQPLEFRPGSNETALVRIETFACSEVVPITFSLTPDESLPTELVLAFMIVNKEK